MLNSKKGISTIILLILLLCSAIVGAFVSYLWVMANYYNMPENTTILVVEEVTFPESPSLDFSYFNVTILNPSNSISDVNVTVIKLTIEESNEVYNITTTAPEELPFIIKRGTRQTIKCLANWSNIAGKIVKIDPVATETGILTLSYSCRAPNAKLKLQPSFNAEVSVEYFNLTVENSGSLNLTISDIIVRLESIGNNVTPHLPYVLSPGQSETFICYWKWDWRTAGTQNINVTITVETTEGYATTYTTNALPGAYIYIDEVKFDYSDTSYFNLTISNSQDSTATAYLNQINLTSSGETVMLNTIPPLQIIPISILPNNSLTIKCLWNWSEHRNKTIDINVYTKQGFNVSTMTQILPSEIIWNISTVSFDLDYMNYFLVNVTNMPCSLGNITVTQILLNGTTVGMEPSTATLSNGVQKTFNCSISWENYRGGTANVTVLTTEGNISRILEIPAVELKILGENPVYGDLQDPEIGISVPYINITISNSANSLQNATITRIIIEGNGICEIDGSLSSPKLVPDGYLLVIGENVTIVCLWNYVRYLPQGGSLTVTVYTLEGIRVSKTWHVPQP